MAAAAYLSKQKSSYFFFTTFANLYTVQRLYIFFYARNFFLFFFSKLCFLILKKSLEFV